MELYEIFAYRNVLHHLPHTAMDSQSSAMYMARLCAKLSETLRLNKTIHFLILYLNLSINPINMRTLLLFLFLSCTGMAYTQPTGKWYCCGNPGMAEKISLYSTRQNCSAVKCVYTHWDFTTTNSPGNMTISSGTCCWDTKPLFDCAEGGYAYRMQYDSATQRITLVSGTTTYSYTITKQTATELELVLVK